MLFTGSSVKTLAVEQSKCMHLIVKKSIASTHATTTEPAIDVSKLLWNLGVGAYLSATNAKSQKRVEIIGGGTMRSTLISSNTLCLMEVITLEVIGGPGHEV